jgi:hypothetical protein
MSIFSVIKLKPHAKSEWVAIFTFAMRKCSQVIEIIRLVTLLMGGLGTASAYAQAPTFSPPNLPTIPGAPAAPASPSAAIPNAPGLVSPPKEEVVVPAAPGTPGLSDLSKAPVVPVAAPVTQPTDDALADLPAPKPSVAQAPNPEAGDVLGGAPTGSSQPSNLITVGAAPAADTSAPPAPEANLPPPLALAPPPISGIPQATSLPEIDVPSDGGAASATTTPPPNKKTWLSKLAPSVIPPKTNFNYKRELLPAAIYRNGYDRDNSHLPVRLTREDYQRMLVASAARNDINATRALLNAGTDINTTIAGPTPLIAARRAGAVDTANLLLARGAR